MPTIAHVHSKRPGDRVDSTVSHTCPRENTESRQAESAARLRSTPSARCLRSYFKAALPKTDSVPPVDAFFFFDRGDMRSIANAHENARAAAAELGSSASLSVWAAPVVHGPWSSVPVIGLVPGAAS